MGPLLYLVYSNDLAEDINTVVKLFADDITLGATRSSATDCMTKLQNEVDKVSRWAKKWKVTLNPLKTKCLTVSRRGFEFSPLLLDGKLVEEVASHCHLGLRLRLQSNGRWTSGHDQQDQQVLKRFNRSSLLQLYLAYIRPILEYRGFVWTNIGKGEADSLEAVQLAALRTITGAKLGTNHFNLYRELDLPTLKSRRKMSMILKLHEILNRRMPGRLDSSDIHLVTDRNPYPARRGDDLKLQQYHQLLLTTNIVV